MHSEQAERQSACRLTADEEHVEQLRCSMVSRVRPPLARSSLPSTRPVRGRGAMGLWLSGVWCVRTTGAGTHGAECPAGGEAAGEGGCPQVPSRGVHWPQRGTSGASGSRGQRPLWVLRPLAGHSCWEQGALA